MSGPSGKHKAPGFAGATLWDFWNNRSRVLEEEKPPAEAGGK